MKISLNWLNDYVDLRGIDVKDIVSRFSLTTAEVEGYEVRGGDISGVVVGEIKTCERHPNSNKLWKLTVEISRGISSTTFRCCESPPRTPPVPVVCGAPNCRVGLKVAFAAAGAKLGEVVVGKATVAGCESFGMCLSARELGISNDHDGIIELDASAKVGTDICDVLPEIRDTIIEVDNKSLTNRPDLWGHYGIAREMAVIFGKKLKPLDVVDLKKFDSLPKVPVVIENKKDCLSYGAIRINGITRGKAPLFMQTRLYYCGINPHGFLVDLSNYVMLDTAQPNHAFAADKVGKISVGNVPAGGSFVTLKDDEVKTTPEMLFIKSDGKPVALAGVMGGKNSEISDETRDCVFEFAAFDATCIRKTATGLGLRTDASARFEKSLDTNLNAVAAGRMVALINKYDKAAKVTSAFSRVVAAETAGKKITLAKSYVERFCGMKFDWAEVVKNLTGLGFAPVLSAENIAVTVPTWRASKDVTCEADVIEEIVRTFGYDNVKPVAPMVELRPVEQLARKKLDARLKDLLVDRFRCDEVHTYIWNDAKMLAHLGIVSPSFLRIVNSCNKENDAIRSELAPSLLGVVARNRQFDEVRVFEIGQVLCGKHGEERNLGVAVSSKTRSAEVVYKELADMVRDVFGGVGVSIKFKLGDSGRMYLHPKNNAAITVDGKMVGFIGVFVDKAATAVCEVNIDSHVIARSETTRQSCGAVRVSKYPKSVLDFTFNTAKPYGAMEEAFEKFKHKYNMGFRLKDVYEGGADFAYTLAFTVGSYEKTLTAEEINEFVQAAIKHGKAAGFAIKE